ncbi:hypothetical protein GCM10017711_40190 [Paeniglutamicibacter sulfureus]
MDTGTFLSIRGSTAAAKTATPAAAKTMLGGSNTGGSLLGHALPGLKEQCIIYFPPGWRGSDKVPSGESRNGPRNHPFFAAVLSEYTYRGPSHKGGVRHRQWTHCPRTNPVDVKVAAGMY